LIGYLRYLKMNNVLISLLNPFIAIGSLFVILIFMYSLKISSLYHPDIFYIIFLFSFTLLLFLFNRLFTVKLDIKKKIIILLQKINFKKKYIIACCIFFLLGTFANIYEYNVVGWPIFLQNKVTRGDVLHYTHYITNFLMYSLLLAYVGSRLKTGLIRYFLIIIFFVSLAELLVWLNRGPLLILVLEVTIFEYLMAYKYHKIRKYLYMVSLLLIIFILLFGYFGDLRVAYVMENIYGHTINFHYGMNESIPTSLVWVYMYATSSFENFRDMFYNQEILHYRYGMLLVYPFIAPIFKQFFNSHTETYPYLDDIAGLNVSSFLEDSFNDFYVFGPYIYVLYMSIMFTISLKVMSRGLFGFLAYISVFNMGVWMFFVNGFAIGPFVLGFLFFLILSIIFERYKIVNN